MSSLFNYQGFACHRYIEQMLERFRIPGAYLTVSQLSTGLKDFGVNFLSNGQIKKRLFFCMFSYTKNVCRDCHRWYAAPQERALQ